MGRLRHLEGQTPTTCSDVHGTGGGDAEGWTPHWELLGPTGRCWDPTGSCWDPMGSAGTRWELLGSHTGSCWGHTLGAGGTTHWEVLGPHWEVLGPHTGSCWDPIGSCWNHTLGGAGTPLGAARTPLGAAGAHWELLGPHTEPWTSALGRAAQGSVKQEELEGKWQEVAPSWTAKGRERPWDRMPGPVLPLLGGLRTNTPSPLHLVPKVSSES